MPVRPGLPGALAAKGVTEEDGAMVPVSFGRALGIAGALVAGVIGCGGRAAGDRDATIVRVVEDPDDVAAQLRLAALEDRAGRPAAALEALEEAMRRRTPLGADLESEDRRRLARLLAQRGQERLGRGAASAGEDLRRAREAGWLVSEAELLAAEEVAALAEARHSEERRRNGGLEKLAKLSARPGGEEVWKGALAQADDKERVALGVWLWERGARRAGYELLERGQAGRDEGARDVYLEARAWWAPSWRGEAPLPEAALLVGPRRCDVVPPAEARRWGCDAAAVVSGGPGVSEAERAALRTPPVAERDPEQAAAWVSIVMRGGLEDEVAGVQRELSRRVDVAWVTAVERRRLIPLYARPTLLRMAGAQVAAKAALAMATAVPPAVASQRLVLACELLLSGAPPARAMEMVKEDAEAPAVLRLRSIARGLEMGSASGTASASPAPSGSAEPRTIAEWADQAAAAAAMAMVGGAPGSAPHQAPAAAAQRQAMLRQIAAQLRREASVARRLAADFVATSDDAAIAWAQLGALYSLLDDPASARAAWQAAVDRSPEPALVRGLALALAAAGDPDAALLAMVQAAAASGDPSPVLIEVAAELVRAGSPLHGLQAAKDAIDLASPATARTAVAVAHRAALALGRPAEARALEALGADPGPDADADAEVDGDADGDDAPAAAGGDRSNGQGSAQSGGPREGPRSDQSDRIDRLWRASRWAPRSVPLRAALLGRLPPADPRRPLVLRELASLAVSAERTISAAAVAALRGAR